MNALPCVKLTGPRVRDGLHERDTSAIVVKTGWGAGLMVRRRYLAQLDSGFAWISTPEAWWVWCETSCRWRLCEPAGMFNAHAGDRP